MGVQSPNGVNTRRIVFNGVAAIHIFRGAFVDGTQGHVAYRLNAAYPLGAEFISSGELANAPQFGPRRGFFVGASQKL